MSLTRFRSAGVPCRQLTAPYRRWATTSQGEQHSNFSKEDFATPFWRNTLILAGLVAVAYKYAPEPGSNVYLTRWIAMYTTPAKEWLEVNTRNTALRAEVANNTRLTTSAGRPPVHRYRYPQAFEQASPFLVGVGTQTDLSDLVVKTK
ncbi:hypothetical protein Ac2012v2_004854 [Leucoagaricus gongylophorus]